MREVLDALDQPLIQIVEVAGSFATGYVVVRLLGNGFGAVPKERKRFLNAASHKKLHVKSAAGVHVCLLGLPHWKDIVERANLVQEG